ncbi:AsmA-like C-terminal region-containing protein [Candidatus Pelagibacter sp. HIMB1321]|uniref:AsmA-like C-terminal region-containing protein n=1 Tax=Candidatus Pelagibacter sp. HIMB1321 TaxID=1388755 RepID=UPI000A07DCC5|nr:AsmA-like C-terminal region-containing protein [Candidatus Pelagibacter sp. HIMB1321]SMF72585.1 AsmA-like C-terminal region [Candidatus Pelagibacter sp. HIMB1321]
MKKLIYRIVISSVLITILTIIYLSTIGVKTEKFNDQIISKVKEINSNFDLKLNQVSVKLNPINLTIDLKTLGTDFSFKNKIIQLENLKTQISLKSIFKDEFALNEISISTKSIPIKNLIILAQEFTDSEQLLFANQILDNGYIVTDLKFEFDEIGNLKDNFIIKGLVYNAQLSVSNKKISKLNFIFQANNKELNLEDLTFLLNNKNLVIPKIKAERQNNNVLVEGNIQSKDLNLQKNELKKFTDNKFLNTNLNNLTLSSDSDFKFYIDQKFKIKNLNIKSLINVKKLDIKNSLSKNIFLPNTKDNIIFENQKIDLNYNNNTIKIVGSGEVFIQNNADFLKYKITNNKDDYFYDLNLDIKKNPLVVDFINFEKNIENDLKLQIKGELIKNRLKFDKIILSENKNVISIKNLKLSDKYEIEEVNNIQFNFQDKSNHKNELELKKNNNEYLITGKSFNADKLLTDLLKSNDNDKKQIFSKNFKLKIDIKKILLDPNNAINNLKGEITFNNNKVTKLNLDSNFSNNQKITFTIRENNGEKITTLFSGEAKPFVDRYKFIKGFSEGKLDFYSSKKDNASISTLKIYDFKLKELPILTKILTLASLQGIADLLSGEGIRFNEFEMSFSNKGNLMTIDEIYAIGPAISILMEGYVEKDSLISLRGTLVPATTINKAIGSIPLIGNILVGKKVGEGVFGVSFKVKGPPKNLETSVNPIKTLTPRFIIRTLEKIKKN